MTTHDAMTPIAPSGPASPVVAARRGWGELATLVGLVVLAVVLNYARGPTPSAVFPGINGPATTPRGSDPPSLDELLNLALSTGRGVPLETYPVDTLLRDVPAWTSLKDAAPWWAVWTHMDGVAHPPLYMQLLRLWRSAFGESDLAAVAMSYACSAVALVFVYLAGRRAFGRPAGFWSAAIFAVAPVSGYFANEIRGYALLTAEAAIALWVLVRMTLDGPRTRDVIGLCVALLACMLTHYFAAVACVAAGAYAVLIAGRRWPRVLLAGVFTAAVYAGVWLPFAVRQLHILKQDLGYLDAGVPNVGRIITLAVKLPYRLLAENFVWPPDAIAVGGCALVLAGVVVLAVKRPAMRPFVV